MPRQSASLACGEDNSAAARSTHKQRSNIAALEHRQCVSGRSAVLFQNSGMPPFAALEDLIALGAQPSHRAWPKQTRVSPCLMDRSASATYRVPIWMGSPLMAWWPF